MAENKEFVVLSVFVILVIMGSIIYDSMDNNNLTGFGIKKWKKKIKHTWQKTGIENVDNKIKAEIGRTDDNLKEIDDKIKAEAKRAEKRFKKNINNFKDELNQIDDRVKAEINRIDDNLKELADAPKEEWRRFKERINNEIKAQKAVLKGLRKGDICATLNAAETTQVYDVKRMISDMVSQIKPVVRPIVEKLVITIASPLNAIPIVGNVLYGAAIAMIDPLTDRAIKEIVNELLEECE